MGCSIYYIYRTYILYNKTMEKKHVRKIIKFAGYSYAIIIPREVIAEFHWQKGQQLELTVDAKRKTVELKDWKE